MVDPIPHPNFPSNNNRYTRVSGGSSDKVGNSHRSYGGIRQLIDDYIDNPSAAKFTNSSNNPYYGPIEDWDTSQVTDMSDAFFGKVSASSYDISGWDVSNVVNMYRMFYSYRAFDEDISGWDVSNVKNMFGMFYDSVHLIKI